MRQIKIQCTESAIVFQRQRAQSHAMRGYSIRERERDLDAEALLLSRKIVARFALAMRFEAPSPSGSRAHSSGGIVALFWGRRWTLGPRTEPTRTKRSDALARSSARLWSADCGQRLSIGRLASRSLRISQLPRAPTRGLHAKFRGVPNCALALCPPIRTGSPPPADPEGWPSTARGDRKPGVRGGGHLARRECGTHRLGLACAVRETSH